MKDIYEAVIGLEVHAELKTESKIFCSCPTAYGKKPNTQICPVCMGLPGTLPVLNARAVEYAVRAGLATGCEIARRTHFDRKNYFYPDLPKAYQISQYDRPLCFGGGLNVSVPEGEKRIGITRIHLEEDAGKLLHTSSGETLIDYNRCGVPLIEIVSEPDIRTAEEARAYLAELREVLLYAGVSDCRMNEGSLRCDINVSVRRRGDSALGVRTEIKNVNSFAFAAKAIEYEVERQTGIIESGGSVACETRRFDSASGRTFVMRRKESADDYRFFPEPDLPKLFLDGEYISRIKRTLPKLPAERRKEYTEKYGITPTDARTITAEPVLAEYFERVAQATAYPRVAANILLTELLPLFNAERGCPVSSEVLCELSELYGEGTVNSATVKRLVKLYTSEQLPSESVRAAVERLGLAQINDAERILELIDAVAERFPKLISDYKNGKQAARNAIIGRVMASASGLVNPLVLDGLLDDRLFAEDKT